MSSEWTIVTGNKRNIKVSTQPVAVIEKNTEISQVTPTRQEKIQIENEKRQKKIHEYNAEFPLFPGSKDLVTDAKKIAYIDAKDTAQRLRHQEESCEWHMEQYEREQEEEEERREAIYQAEKQKYIAQQTANMTEREKKIWIQDYEYYEMLELEDQVFSYWDSVYWHSQKKEREYKERLDRWNAKQENKK